MMKPILYRQFDRRTIYYQDNLVFRTRRNVMRHMYQGDNVALLSPRITGDDYAPFVSREMISNKAASRYDQSYIFPLYLYPDPNHPVYTETGHLNEFVRVNFDLEIYAAIRAAAGLDKEPLREIHDKRDGGKPDEMRVFDYIYGVLHSPEYRATYAQFLKIDFPRVPYPASPKVFADVAEKGGQLRRLHLMDDAAVGETPYPFQGSGSGEVVKPEYEAGRVRINPEQWFDDVTAVAWGFNIGGYQPAQKWLKDRKGRMLSFDDVRHYQKIIKILVETDRIMNEIDLPL